jgi:esterase/lipase
MIFTKLIKDDSLRKGKILYLMGATWHTKCMFDLECAEDSFATLLHKSGIETYTFDIPVTDHQTNVDIAVELVKQYEIDYILGYSYGCITAIDVAKQIKIAGLMFLDPRSQVTVNKQYIDNKILVTRNNVELALHENNVNITNVMRQAHLSALSDTDILTVPPYPGPVCRQTEYFEPASLTELFNTQKIQLFLTSQSKEETRSWNPANTIFYPNSSHWILLESGRRQLAQDVEKFILN